MIDKLWEISLVARRIDPIFWQQQIKETNKMFESRRFFKSDIPLGFEIICTRNDLIKKIRYGTINKTVWSTNQVIDRQESWRIE